LASVAHKLEEGYFYINIELSSPSLEIGSGDFTTSTIFFKGKKIDIGSDIALGLGVNESAALEIFHNLVAFDAQHIPFTSSSIQDILMVHIVDHIPDLDLMLHEISRVLKDEGNFYFSGYSSDWMTLVGAKRRNRVPVYTSFSVYNSYLSFLRLIDHPFSS